MRMPSTPPVLRVPRAAGQPGEHSPDGLPAHRVRAVARQRGYTERHGPCPRDRDPVR
ncbi:hypothetical protein STVIR_7464 [Streptomyces viridochromogenes Tue57]|uniref:Uncharacterized protein n=1 Tax=Streptomyces viridochromogenes Tue57 TaxID=1160705 RepID=L8P8F6_STRVR|nr:hypothetical protein STVIR_7464 [Streptomyces viridochromogenes Tue57]